MAVANKDGWGQWELLPFASVPCHAKAALANMLKASCPKPPLVCNDQFRIPWMGASKLVQWGLVGKRQCWGDVWKNGAKGPELVEKIDEQLNWWEDQEYKVRLRRIKGHQGWARDESELLSRLRAIVTYAIYREGETEGHKVQIRSWNTAGMSDTTIAEKVEGGDTVKSMVLRLARKGVVLVQEHKMDMQSLRKLVAEYRSLGVAAAAALEANAGQKKYGVAVFWNSYKMKQPIAERTHWEGRVVSARFSTKAGPVTYASMYIPPPDTRMKSTLSRIRKCLKEMGTEGNAFAGGDFNFTEGEKYNKGYREEVETVFAEFGYYPTLGSEIPTYKAGESYTSTDQIFMRNVGLEFCNRKTIRCTATFNHLQESQHALLHSWCRN